MKIFARTALLALSLTACTSIVGDTPVETASGGSQGTVPPSVTTLPPERKCVQVTGGTTPVSTGSVSGDALFLSGELFVCADDVVVAGEDDLNEVAAGAQLAAALGGPILFPHPQLAAELGRLKPLHIHVLGEVEVVAPPSSVVNRITIADAVDLTTEALGVTVDLRLPSIPDESTVIETVLAITDADRAVLPQTVPSDETPDQPQLDPAQLVVGLAVPNDSESVWLVDAANPVGILSAAGTGRSVGATVVAYDPEDILGYPEVGDALAGLSPDAVRYVGTVPEVDEWEIRLLADGTQVPGGGFHILPEDQPRRYVSFYGHPTTPALGALGEQPPGSTWTRMQPYLRDYAGDGSQVIPTFEMIASVASANSTDGDYSYEWPIETFDQYIALAEEHDGYVILDLQPGRDDFLMQAKEYEELLKLPFVGLALDPEWRLGPNEVHLRQVGSVSAAEVNEVVDWLADLVREHALPQKIIIVHQFRESMIENREDLKERPELQMIIQMDGDGSEGAKDATYGVLTEGTETAHWAWGWKNFFDEDEPGPPTPESTMGKDPVPVYVSYQ